MLCFSTVALRLRSSAPVVLTPMPPLQEPFLIPTCAAILVGLRACTCWPTLLLAFRGAQGHPLPNRNAYIQADGGTERWGGAGGRRGGPFVVPLMGNCRAKSVSFVLLAELALLPLRTGQECCLGPAGKQTGFQSAALVLFSHWLQHPFLHLCASHSLAASLTRWC